MSNVVTPQPPTRPSAKDEPAPMVIAESARRRPLSRDRLTAILMLVPSLIAIAFFVYWFIAWNVWASLTDWKGIGVLNQVGPLRFPAANFSGLYNYQRLFSDSRFLGDLRNNAIFTFFFLLACIVLGLLLAIFLDQRIKGEVFFRNVFLFPMALSFVVTGTIWRWLFLDLKWITDRNLALPAVIVAAGFRDGHVPGGTTRHSGRTAGSRTYGRRDRSRHIPSRSHPAHKPYYPVGAYYSRPHIPEDI